MKRRFIARVLSFCDLAFLFVHSARNKTNECKEKRRAVNKIQLLRGCKRRKFLTAPLFLPVEACVL